MLISILFLIGIFTVLAASRQANVCSVHGGTCSSHESRKKATGVNGA